MSKKHFMLINALAVFLLLSASGAALALPPAPDGYDSVTGEPRCIKCHNGERKYSIDYTREPSCFSCHGPGLSERYIAINKKFRLGPGDTGYLGKMPPHQAAVDHAGGMDRAGVLSTAAPETGSAAMVLAAAKPAAATKKPSKTGRSIARSKPGAAKKKRHVKKRKGMVYVPGGEFIMGSDDWWPKSQPEHKRYVKPFYIDKYEVTNKRYAAFVKATGHAPPRNWPGGQIPPGKENHPVTYVSWFDADAFCKWEGKHLPYEEQWEKAARGTDGRAFPWGNRFSRKKANTPQYGFGNTMPVGSFPQGVSPYGVHDMVGNVWEWVDNWFKPYPGNKHPDENYGERFKVLRGGSWYDCTYYKCGISAPSYNRIFFNPNTSNNNFGFRCAADAEK